MPGDRRALPRADRARVRRMVVSTRATDRVGLAAEARVPVTPREVGHSLTLQMPCSAAALDYTVIATPDLVTGDSCSRAVHRPGRSGAPAWPRIAPRGDASVGVPRPQRSRVASKLTHMAAKTSHIGVKSVTPQVADVKVSPSCTPDLAVLHAKRTPETYPTPSDAPHRLEAHEIASSRGIRVGIQATLHYPCADRPYEGGCHHIARDRLSAAC
jgi:hypothetical protein